MTTNQSSTKPVRLKKDGTPDRRANNGCAKRFMKDSFFEVLDETGRKAMHLTQEQRSELARKAQSHRTTPFPTGENHHNCKYSDNYIREIKAFMVANRRAERPIAHPILAQHIDLSLRNFRALGHHDYRPNAQPSESQIQQAHRKIIQWRNQLEAYKAQLPETESQRIDRARKYDKSTANYVNQYGSTNPQKVPDHKVATAEEAKTIDFNTGNATVDAVFSELLNTTGIKPVCQSTLANAIKKAGNPRIISMHQRLARFV
ncbi:hypothetical protein AB4345_05345 [Vibrio breoganii]